MKPLSERERAEALDLLPRLAEDDVLPRRTLAAVLTVSGRPITSSTLASLACRGGGPEYRMFGSRSVYPWGPARAWAESRTRTLA